MGIKCIIVIYLISEDFFCWLKYLEKDREGGMMVLIW